MNQYGQRIREIRERRGISQVLLAEMLGVDPSHICRVERGKGDLSLRLLQETAKALDATVSDLLDNTPAKASGE